MNDRAKRDRPAKNPGGVQCERCEEIFIGEEWHVLCADCISRVAGDIADEQNLDTSSPMAQVVPNGKARQ